LLFWASSPRLELIALGEFLGETGRYTKDNELVYNVKYLTPVVDRPIRLSELRADPTLTDAIFLKKGPAASIVRLSEGEGTQLYRLLISQNNLLRGVWPDLESGAAVVPDVDESAMEGNRRLVQHFRAERNRALVEAKKKSVLALSGRLACEICDFDFAARYGAFGEGFCEVHHRRPLSTRKAPSVTRLHDLAVVCSNCHRVLHRSGCMLSIEEARRKFR
jgi:hypothetical protein